MVSNEKYYKPEEALHELMIQETIVNVSVDIQALLRILVDKEIISKEEVAKYREEVRNSPKYKPVISKIQEERRGFQMATENPQEYLKALLKAKMNKDIK